MWDDRSVVSSSSPSTRRPKKDGYYDHAMNCLEYLTLMFGPSIPSTRPKPQTDDDEFSRYIYPITSEHSWMA